MGLSRRGVRAGHVLARVRRGHWMELEDDLAPVPIPHRWLVIAHEARTGRVERRYFPRHSEAMDYIATLRPPRRSRRWNRERSGWSCEVHPWRE